MRKALLFTKRNLTEMVRDPLIYIFCAGFPVAMILIFQLILHYSGESTPVFYVKSLIPGVIMFGYSLVMLMTSLLVSKDRTSAFLKRLFTSPLKSYQFIIGYAVPFLIVGLIQDVLCITLGYIFGATSGTGFISFDKAILLVVEMLPMLITCIMLGILFGTLLNDKSAPGICSIFISASGILGGSWMPIDVMGEFESVCTYLPFYPSVALGRIITNASHTIPNTYYTFSENGVIYLLVMLGYLALSLFLAIYVFSRKMNSTNN